MFDDFDEEFSLDNLDGSEIIEAAKSAMVMVDSDFSFDDAIEFIKDEISDGFLPDEILDKTGYFSNYEEFSQLADFYGVTPSDYIIERILNSELDEI